MKSNVLSTIVPPITGLVDEAYPLVVALSHPRPWPWFYSNYIQMAFKNDDLMGYNVRFYKTDHRGIMWDTLNPWINYNIMNVNFLKSLNMGIIDFIVQSIDNGFYMSVFLDRYYLPGIRNYQKSHMTHEAMVFGYDLEKEQIYLIEYQETYLKEFIVTFAEFIDAYDNSDLSRYEDIHLMKFDTQRHYEFDLVNISEQLQDYLSSQNTSERYRINSNPVYSPLVSFGLDIYNDLRFLLEYNHLKYDIRVFNSIWEHKKVMKDRVQYMADQGYVDGIAELVLPCKEIEDKSYLLKSQFMKLCATRNPAQVGKVLLMLNAMEELERSVYGKIVEKIKAQIAQDKIRQADAWYSEHSFSLGTHQLERVQADRVSIDFDLLLKNEVVEGLIGYTDSKNQVIANSSMFILLRINAVGYFEASDGDAFRISTPVTYARNGQCHVHVEVDYSTRTYGISLDDGNGPHFVAEHFHFNPHVQEPGTIGKVCLVTDNMSSFLVTNHRITPC